jgi:hypothetical protein
VGGVGSVELGGQYKLVFSASRACQRNAQNWDKVNGNVIIIFNIL